MHACLYIVTSCNGIHHARVRVLNCCSNRAWNRICLNMRHHCRHYSINERTWSVVCSTELHNHSMCGFLEVLHANITN